MSIKFIKLCFIYILLLLSSVFLFAFNNDTSVSAKVTTGTPLDPKIMSVTGNAGMNSTEIVSSTCYSWKKPGSTCEVKIQFEASTGAYCGNSSMTFVFDKNEKITKHSGGNPSGGLGSSSTYCNWSATVQAFNFDSTPPMWVNLTFNLSGSTCTKTKNLSGNRSGEGEVVAQCLGTVTATSTAELDEYESGVPRTTVSTKCKPGGGTCYLNAVDNVGNKQSNQSSYGSYNSIRFKIGKDTTKCSATTISITGGTNYNGYYVGSVTCTAKCTKDNIKVAQNIIFFIN